MQKRIAVEHEKHEDGPDKKSEAHDSFDDISCSKFQYHSLTQTILEKTQFKMLCGTYDPC